ncbi:MAG: aminopeptidase P family N-terminal domain-containing protein, partial [Muribaculaceae bacterium]|nr:aminopeptidase P family N-terminal domain-containing protein [Muribaculaceae bacterium]
MTPITIERLETLRDAMRRVNVDAVIIPGTDPHQSEYPAAHWKFRDWLTGFTGSNGTAIVTLEAAGLWTDSRYFLQAEQQLEGSGIDLYREGLPDTPSQHEFLAAQLDEDDVVAIDGRLFTLNEVNRLDR